jgi:hypothetical protein
LERLSEAVSRFVSDRDRRVVRAVALPRDASHVCVTKLCRGLCKLVEHDLKIEARATYDVQRFGSGGLLLQRFVTFTCSAIELFLPIRRRGSPARRCARFGSNRLMAPAFDWPPTTVPSHVAAPASLHGQDQS